MRIYVAGHNQEDARRVGRILEENGHTVTSSWLKEDFSSTSSYTESDKTSIADKDAREVVGSDLLLLLSSPYRVPGGKFIETGIAIGANKRVCIIGSRENMLTWKTGIKQYVSVEDFVKCEK